MSKKKGPYGEEEGSILAGLWRRSSEDRKKYQRNRNKQREEQRAMDEWADDGFTSSPDDRGKRSEDEDA